MPVSSEIELDRMLQRLSLEEKVRLLTGRDSWSLHPLPSIGLRSIVMSDGPVGVRGDTWDERSPSVNFPSPTALAASWSSAVVFAVGEALGEEARRKGVDVLLAPTINLHRSPYGGRHFEAFSEDPLLTAALASAYVSGVQSRGVGATVKHYVANESETDRFTVDVRVAERPLRELYLSAFEEPVVEAGAWLVMSAYNSVNGTTASEHDLLTNPLKTEWGFDGVVVSDWTAVRSLDSARSEQDLAMPGPHSPWSQGLLQAVRDGRVPESAIDAKVRRILRLAARVGALENGMQPSDAIRNGVDPVRVARDSAVAGTVLLRNDGILPLGAPARIAVIGEGAVEARTQGGGSATVIPERVVAPLDALRARWPHAEAAWAPGVGVQTRPSSLPVDSFFTIDGEPGMMVRYLDAAGAELLSERREASQIVSFDGDSLATRSHTVEMSFRYYPPEDRPLALAVTGLCDYELLVDGSPTASGSPRTAPGDDPATAVLTPPFELASLGDRDERGDGFEIVLRLRPVAGGIPDAISLGVGLPPRATPDDDLIAEAARLAAHSDVAVVIVSTSPEVESEGFDRASLHLPGRQDDLVAAVAAANPRTVVIVNTGAPVILPCRESVAAILAVWFPGQQFGEALAAVLSGDEEPGGRLPVTWPTSEDEVPVSAVRPTDGRLDYSEGLLIGYRAWISQRRVPAYPFGFGLGYTTFRVTSLHTSAPASSDDELSAEVTVVNTGTRAGKVVAQVYGERIDASAVDRPQRWLIGFLAASLDAGEERTLTIGIPRRRLAHWDGEWVVEPGAYRLVAGFAVDDEAATAVVTVS